MSLVHIEALCKRFGALEVLKGVDLAVEIGGGRRHHRSKRLGQEHSLALR